MIDPLTITDEPTARAHADMIFQGEIKAIQEFAGEWLADDISLAMWWAWGGANLGSAESQGERNPSPAA